MIIRASNCFRALPPPMVPNAPNGFGSPNQCTNSSQSGGPKSLVSHVDSKPSVLSNEQMPPQPLSLPQFFYFQTILNNIYSGGQGIPNCHLFGGRHQNGVSRRCSRSSFSPGIRCFTCKSSLLQINSDC